MSKVKKHVFVKWLEAAGIQILNYEEGSWPIRIRGSEKRISIKSLIERGMAGGRHLFENSENGFDLVPKIALNEDECRNIIKEYADSAGINVSPGVEDVETAVAEAMKGMSLYVDPSAEASNRRSISFYLVDERNRIAAYSPELYIQGMGIKDPMRVRGLVVATRQYIPFKRPGILQTVMDEHDRNVFNTYIPPLWKDVKGHSKPTSAPALFRKFMKALLPKESERKFVYAWMAKSIMGRAQTHLVLCANPGVGKNRLQLIMKALHGEKNTTAGKHSSLGKFNSQLGNCTLLWYDELTYGPDEVRTLKEIPNEEISIEAKGEDASRSSKIYASVVISNNKPRDNHLEFNDRKFSPVILRKQRLELSMSAEQIDKLSKKVTLGHKEYDNEFVAQIARFLKKNYGEMEDVYPNMEYRGPKFWQLAQTSMTKAQKKSVDLVLEAFANPDSSPLTITPNGIQWSQVETQLDKKLKDLRMADNTTFQTFFENFRGLNGNQVFETVEVKKSSNLVNDFYINLTKAIRKDRSQIFEIQDGRNLVEEENKESETMARLSGREKQVSDELEEIFGTKKVKKEKTKSGEDLRAKKLRRLEAANNRSVRTTSKEDSDRPTGKRLKPRKLEEDSERSGRIGKTPARRNKDRRSLPGAK